MDSISENIYDVNTLKVNWAHFYLMTQKFYNYPIKVKQCYRRIIFHIKGYKIPIFSKNQKKLAA